MIGSHAPGSCIGMQGLSRGQHHAVQPLLMAVDHRVAGVAGQLFGRRADLGFLGQDEYAAFR